MLEALLGLDVGSGSAKAAVIDVETGALIGACAVPYAPARPEPGVAEYEGEAIYRAVLRAARSAIRASSAHIRAVCVDAMVSGILGVDASGIPVTPYTTTLDTRFERYLGAAEADRGSELKQRCGSSQPVFATKIQWLLAGGLADRAVKFLPIGSFVTMRLAGVAPSDAVVDPTHLWASGLWDRSAGEWAGDLCAYFEIDLEILPQIAPSLAIVGDVSSAAASAIGVQSGTPLACGVADQQAGFVAAGVTETGDVASVAGTYPVVAVVAPASIAATRTDGVDLVESPIDGRSYLMSVLVGGGLTHRWFVETFGGAASEESYAILDHAASMIDPGSAGLLFNPHFAAAESGAGGGWTGVNWAHTLPHFYRSVLEACALEQASQLDAIVSSVAPLRPQLVKLYGGGSRSDLWNQIKADVTGLRHARQRRSDLAAIGGAYLAGLAIGCLDVPRSEGKDEDRLYEPDQQANLRYREIATSYAQFIAGC